LLPLPCAILIYLSKFVKKLYEFYLWPAHDALLPLSIALSISLVVACHLPHAVAPLWTTSVSISCYRLFPPNLHTQNNLTASGGRDMRMRRLSSVLHRPASLGPSLSFQLRPRAAPINFHLVSINSHDIISCRPWPASGSQLPAPSSLFSVSSQFPT